MIQLTKGYHIPLDDVRWAMSMANVYQLSISITKISYITFEFAQDVVIWEYPGISLDVPIRALVLFLIWLI